MIPPIYHSLRREAIKNAAHSHPYGVRSIRPTWFEDTKLSSQPTLGEQRAFQPMHGLKLHQRGCNATGANASFPRSRKACGQWISREKLEQQAGNCEKRKPRYTSCVLKSTLPYRKLRQTQTPTVVATPQLLSSLPCQIKGTCSTPTPKCTSELLLFSPDATVTRNRSTRTKDGTQPRNTNGQHSPEATKWQLFHLP